MGPAALLEQMAGKVVDMKALHHDDDRAGAFVVEARRHRVSEPFSCAFALHRRHCIRRFLRIVDDDERAAAPGQRAANRR